MHPRIKFKVKPEKDVETFFCFVHDVKFDGGRSLNWAVFKYHPFFKKFKTKSSFKIKKAIVEKYVKSFYIENKKTIDRNVNLYKRNWMKKEKIFQSLVNKLFPNTKWPKGKYVAYPTMWSMYPRFLEDKTFQIPYRHNNPKYVNVIIAHEMLHFMFYEYFYKKYPQYEKDKYNFFIWHISEIFNVIVQNSTDWLSIFHVKSMPYPEHKKLIKKLNSRYRNVKKLDTDSLINDIIKTVKDSNIL